MEDRQNMNFEGSIARLEEIISALEGGEAPLEEAMKLFEEGMVLMRACAAALDEAEQKVTLLTAGEDGAPQARPFQGED